MNSLQLKFLYRFFLITIMKIFRSFSIVELTHQDFVECITLAEITQKVELSFWGD